MNFNAKRDTGYTRLPLLNGNDEDSEEELFERAKDGRAPYRDPGPNKINRVKNKLEGVMHTMKSNIGKIMDRGDRLEDLESKSESFEMSAFQFKSTSTKLQNRLWWHNFKMKCIFGFIVVAVIIIIIVWIVLKYKK